MIELLGVLCLVGLLAVVASTNKAEYQRYTHLESVEVSVGRKADVPQEERFWLGPYRQGGSGEMLYISRDGKWGLYLDGAWRLLQFDPNGGAPSKFTYDAGEAGYCQLMLELSEYINRQRLTGQP